MNGGRLKVLAGVAFAAFAVMAFSPYGVATDGTRSEHGMHDDLADLIKVGGMGYEHLGWFWPACQKEDGGAFDFSKYDKIVEADEARGITVLPIIYGVPPWGHPVWQHLDGYAAFVRETVRRYGKRMPVIEIWNEQNSASFWREGPNATNYLAVLKAAYKAAKEADPSVRVALGGCAGWAHDFIRSLYALGAKDYFDIVSVHPYCFLPEGPLRDGFEKLRKVMAEFGDGQKPIWFTEIGWSTYDVDNVDLVGEGDILLAGLRVARPEKTVWNIIYATCAPDDMRSFGQDSANNLQMRLGEGSKVLACGPKETCALLAAGGWDAVVYPPDTTYPADTFDAVVEFVRKGGTLVDLGGMPMLIPYRGPTWPGPVDGSRDRFRKLKIGLDAFWLPGSELPKNNGAEAGKGAFALNATLEGTAAGVKGTGFQCTLFFTDKTLGAGDRMVPLIAGTNPHNGKQAVAACVYLLDGDMKGRVVVSGIPSKQRAFPISEYFQGVLLARAMGIAFAEGVGAFFLHNLRAREKDRFYKEDHFGLLHANLVPKASWLANKMFITQRPAGSVNLGGEWRKDGLYFPQWRRPDGKIGGMIWTDRAVHDRTCTFDSDTVAFHDMWGKPAVVHGTGRVRQVKVSGEPLYFFGTQLLSVPGRPPSSLPAKTNTSKEKKQ